MSLFPISADKVQLSTDAPVATDSYVGGLLRDAGNTVCRAALSGGVQWSNGLLMTALGQVVYVDATAGLPVGTQFVNGIPLAPSGAMCCSTDAAVNYSNGLPRVLNGAIAATGADLSAQVAAWYAGGMKGIWRESSVMATLYQDSNGAAQVTAPTNPIGLVLSKDQALAQGLEVLPSITNPAGWTATGTWVAGVGGISAVATASGTRIFANGTAIGSSYVGLVSISCTAGSVSVLLGGVQLRTVVAGETLALNYTPLSLATRAIDFRADSAGTSATVTAASVRELFGNHQRQATTQSRPLYQVSPPRPVFDGIDDVLNTTFPTALGTNCTVGRYVPGTGVVILTGQNIGTSFADSVTSGPLVVLDGPLNAGQTATLTAYLTQQGTLP